MEQGVPAGAVPRRLNPVPSVLARAVGLFRVPALICVTAIAVGIVAVPSRAVADPSVTTPSGDPHDLETWAVSGSGFPDHRDDPTGIQILECADRGGLAANLPKSALYCDGTTVNIEQINTDANGNFTGKFQIRKLNSAHTSNIDCDARHFCVLWFGIDYNTSFLGPHAFSNPFEIGGASSSGSSAPILAIVLPIAALALVGGWLMLRRRSSGGVNGPTRSRRDSPVSDKAAKRVGVKA